MITVQEYQDLAGKNRYRTWFNDLDVAAAVKVSAAIERIAQGNRSAIKPVGEGFQNTSSIGDPDIAFTSDKMGKRW